MKDCMLMDLLVVPELPMSDSEHMPACILINGSYVNRIYPSETTN